MGFYEAQRASPSLPLKDEIDWHESLGHTVKPFPSIPIQSSAIDVGPITLIRRSAMKPEALIIPGWIRMDFRGGFQWSVRILVHPSA